jgi:hypothetical protein
MTIPKFTRQHFVLLADTIAPMMFSPTDIERMADILAHTNDRFDRDKFVRRATEAWEEKNIRPEDMEETYEYYFNDTLCG